MSQYMISVWHDDTYEVDFESPENQAKFVKVDAFNTELQEAGVWVFAAGLLALSQAQGPWPLFGAWLLIGAAMRGGLYAAAFAALVEKAKAAQAA